MSGVRIGWWWFVAKEMLLFSRNMGRYGIIGMLDDDLSKIKIQDIQEINSSCVVLIHLQSCEGFLFRWSLKKVVADMLVDSN